MFLPTREPAFSSHGAHWRTRDGVSPAAVRRLIHAASERLEAGARNIKFSRHKSVYFLDLEGKSRPSHLLKTFDYEGVDKLARRFRGCKAYRELQISRELELRGIRAPEALAAGEFRGGGLVTHCWLLVTFMEGARDLSRLTEDELRAAPHLAQDLGHFCRDLHDAGLIQEDLAPNNILLDASGKLWITDFERARLCDQVSDAERWRELARFERYMSSARMTDRVHFLRAYSRGEVLEARRHWAGVARAVRQLAREDVRRTQRAATRDGRRFRRVRWNAWRGHLAHDLEVENFAGLLGSDESASSPQLSATDSFWRVHYPKPWSKRARRYFANAVLLARRRLAPEPAALWVQADSAELFLKRRGETLFDSNFETRSGYARLLRRLQALGSVDGSLGKGDLLMGEVAGHDQVLIAAPHRVRLG